MVSATDLHKEGRDGLSLIQSPPRSVRLAGPGSQKGIEPSWYLLGKQCSGAQSGRFPGCIEDTFLVQSVNGPTRNGALLD